MKIQLIRNATLWLEYAGLNILVDPMLMDAESMPAFPNTPNDLRNPRVSLPDIETDILNPDLLLVTHTHPDHWDEAAATQLRKDIPLICQPGDEHIFIKAGFMNVTPVDVQHEHQSIQFARTSGQHGTGEIGERMGNVSGFVLEAAGEPVTYIAGDTIWCEEPAEAIKTYNPEVIVVNAGGARFLQGDPITMDGPDVAAVKRAAPSAHLIAVHMDAINHCMTTRADLAAYLASEQLDGEVFIPQDGESLELGGKA
ncbi:MBL fold metallo-hydrolase [Paenibacillus silvae]|uniref:MBL fold metallo-hydrolase n=1 Tax=Paenibacillus TaxID=44249 RepID=UPI001C1173CA|nr:MULTISPECIES: MBL fold metallo-hydrolase [Paenibacillus]MBU5353551.1 MBL fold metallo-hydrolase [Paenibacillus barcinonensis]MDM5279480.1 MBL fold metallo-hydrolase [Paenibacillus silvae]